MLVADISQTSEAYKQRQQWKRRRKFLKKILLNLYFLLMICIVVFVYYATNQLSPLLTFVIFSSIIVVFLSNYGKCCSHRIHYPSGVPTPLVVPYNGQPGVWTMSTMPHSSYSTFQSIPSGTAPPPAQTVYIVEQDGMVKQTIITTQVHHQAPPPLSMEQQVASFPPQSMTPQPGLPDYPNAPAYTPNL